MRPRLLVPPLLALLCLARPVAADAVDPFAEQPGTHGFLFETRPKSGAGKLWLYGTIHVGKKDTTPFTRAMKAALGESTQLALEADPSDMGSIVQLGAMSVYQPPDSLDKHLPAPTLEALKKLLPRYHLDPARILQMKLWMVPMMLGLLEAGRLGYDSSYGVEWFLGAYAKQKKLPLIEIEGMAAQVAILSSFPEPILQEALAQSIEELSSGKEQHKLEDLVEAWRTSDRKGIEKALAEMHASKRASEREFEKRMVDERNVVMANRAEELAKGGRVTFFAVGALHLFGERGVVSLLRKRGYTITERR